MTEPISKSADTNAKKQAADSTLADLKPADIEIWSDGSAIGGITNGGAGVLIKIGGAEVASISKLALLEFSGGNSGDQLCVRLA